MKVLKLVLGIDCFSLLWGVLNDLFSQKAIGMKSSSALITMAVKVILSHLLYFAYGGYCSSNS